MAQRAELDVFILFFLTAASRARQTAKDYEFFGQGISAGQRRGLPLEELQQEKQRRAGLMAQFSPTSPSSGEPCGSLEIDSSRALPLR